VKPCRHLLGVVRQPTWLSLVEAHGLGAWSFISDQDRKLFLVSPREGNYLEIDRLVAGRASLARAHTPVLWPRVSSPGWAGMGGPDQHRSPWSGLVCYSTVVRRYSAGSALRLMAKSAFACTISESLGASLGQVWSASIDSAAATVSPKNISSLLGDRPSRADSQGSWVARQALALSQRSWLPESGHRAKSSASP